MPQSVAGTQLPVPLHFRGIRKQLKGMDSLADVHQ